MMRFLVGLTVLLAAGCQQAPAPEADARPAIRPPAKLCGDARASLDALKATAAIDYDEAGTATTFQESWLQVPPPSREAIANALAVVAACAAPEPVAEQEVTITNETGIVVMRRTVELTADPSALLAD